MAKVAHGGCKVRAMFASEAFRVNLEDFMREQYGLPASARYIRFVGFDADEARCLIR